MKSWRFGVRRPARRRLRRRRRSRSPRTQAPAAATVDEDTLRFWVVLGTLKWGVICVGQAFTHLNGLVRSVELATLGRRVAETEWDLLDLLDGGW